MLTRLHLKNGGNGVDVGGEGGFEKKLLSCTDLSH